MKNRKIILLISFFCIVLCACNKKDNAVTPTEGEKQPIHQVYVEDIKQEEEEVIEYTYAPANLVCIIPEEFKETENAGEYLTEDYPKDVSSINQIISESNENPTLKTQEEFEASIEEEYHNGYGDDIDINVTQYDSIVVDGRPGLWVMYNFDFRGEPYNILMVILYNGTETNYITYMEGPGAYWMDKFADSAVTIHFEEIAE